MRTLTKRGTSSLEVLVAFTLLSSVLSLSLPLVVRHGRLLKDQRSYRIALDELSNQLDRLTALPETELLATLEQLAPSKFAETRLPSAELVGEFEPAEVGRRVTLRLSWNGPQRRRVSMAAWIIPQPPQLSEEVGREE